MNWQPIETAPKTGERIMLGFKKSIFTNFYVVFGYWESDKYSKNPRPYWRHDMERISGIGSARINQPDYWAVVPNIPDDSNNINVEGYNT
jgi:hypothetical protein